MKFLFFVFVCMSLLFFAQDTTKSTEKTPATPEEDLQLELEVQSGEFVYKPMGRRDPFWDMLKGRGIRMEREKIEGIAGLLISELTLEGIIFSNGKYKALFHGPKKKPYRVSIGDSVYDGEVIKIDSNNVIFRKILTVPMRGKREQIIKKSIKPEEEENRKNES